MASSNALTDDVALSLFQNIREGMKNGRISDLNTAQSEIEAAIAELSSIRPPVTVPTDVVDNLRSEIGSLHEKVSKCEAWLADFESKAKLLGGETTQIVACTEACSLLVEQQRKESAKVFAAMEVMRSSTPVPCVPPAVSPTNLSLPPPAVASSKEQRVVTIHPPDSPSYQSVIRDNKGDFVIDFRRARPLRREGAFRGSLESINWTEISRVCGRGPEQAGTHVPPSARWPDPSQSSTIRRPFSRSSSDLIARQQHLSRTMQTGPFGRVISSYDLCNEESPLRPPFIPSSQDTLSPFDADHDIASTSTPTPPSPSHRRGKKRTLEDEDDGVPVTEEGPLSTDLRAVKEPTTSTTPTPVKREESCAPEGPAKHKKLRPSASQDGLSIAGGSPSRTHSQVDLTRTT